MKHSYFRILLIICLSVLSITLLAQTTSQTEQYPDYLAASDYSDCSKAPRFSLPLDIDVTEDYWLKGYVEDLTQGVSAYLYSDTDFQFEVYISCLWLTPVYETTFKKIGRVPLILLKYKKNLQRMVFPIIQILSTYVLSRLMAKVDD